MERDAKLATAAAAFEIEEVDEGKHKVARR